MLRPVYVELPGADGVEAQVPSTPHLPHGASAAMKAACKLMAQVAEFDTTVLLQGESGTGKELAARYIHELSNRAHAPFVPVNCGAIPAELLESELFGHRKGAFTGAVSNHRGRFEVAEGGALFLDEIGDMSDAMQIKLLRVLQEHSFEPVGSSQCRHYDVRIIAATHRNLEQAVSEERFREDLYYRLAVFPIGMPPLRERIGDLELLIESLDQRATQRGLQPVSFAPRAMNALRLFDWPGNVRELGNLCERLAILHPGACVDLKQLPSRYLQGAHASAAAADDKPKPQLPSRGMDLRNYLRDLEIGLIREALAATDGTITHAAKLLRLRRTKLIEKMRRFELS